MTTIGFFGTPEIASFCLEGLAGKYSVSFAVTGEDKPAGRHQKMMYSPVKEVALRNNIPVLQPVKLRDPDVIGKINSYNADVYVVVAYGKIIPREIFDFPRFKTINLHPSLLPRYRGAAPVQWALIGGEPYTGITVQRINEELDAGDIILQEKIALAGDMTAGDLYAIVMPLGLRLIGEAVDLLCSGNAQFSPQAHEDATYCGKITRELSCIDWSWKAADIHNLVRGLNPKPGTSTFFRGKNVKIWKTAPFSESGDFSLKPGEVAVYAKKRLIAGSSDGCVEIISLQPETKKVMDALSFINGYRIGKGECFGV
ncbi:MAG TPA: methionyl-tRNA formyltransferase [Spirochaetota bacterium]|nr:methionyl-tRNA formyltransferase [Spirochaetota bacterium]HPI90026.1 methionyl-tRNA formyltransferase [Spirochaetota bacterium]HPR48092.1 methionyl-tRNA formyltransferase [Spirochaetota bacterium]